MARDLGWGGIANTNGARDFSGKEAAGGVSRHWIMLFDSHLTRSLIGAALWR